MFAKKAKEQEKTLLNELRDKMLRRSNSENSTIHAASNRVQEVFTGAGRGGIYPDLQLLNEGDSDDDDLPSEGASATSEGKFGRLENLVLDLQNRVKHLTSFSQSLISPESSPQFKLNTGPISSTLNNENFNFNSPPHPPPQPGWTPTHNPGRQAPQVESNPSNNIGNNNHINNISEISIGALSQQAALALNAVPTFTGKDSSRKFGDFRREIQNILDLYVPKNPNMSDQQHSALLALCLKTRLSGEALCFVTNLPRDITTDIRQVFTALQSRFGTVPNISLLRNELQSLTQGELSVAALVDKISVLVKKFVKADQYLLGCSDQQIQTVTETLKRQTLHSSLNRDIFEELAKQGMLGSFDAMVSQAQEIETTNKVIRARNEGIRSTRAAKILAVEAENGNSATQPQTGNTAVASAINRQHFRPRYNFNTRPRFRNRNPQPPPHPRFTPPHPTHHPGFVPPHPNCPPTPHFPPPPFFPPRQGYYNRGRGRGRGNI